MTALALRSIGSNDDFAVLYDGLPVGIRYASELTNQVWMRNFTVAVPGGGHGTSANLEEAKASFKKPWIKFKQRLGQND
jgi:hypothetical protein